MGRNVIGLSALALILGACGHETAPREASRSAVDGTIVTIRSAQIPAEVDAAGTAQPIAQATLSTRLMATVTAVHVREGDRVRAGAVLAVLDARDLVAKNVQVEASIAGAEAMQHEAETQAARMRTLYAQDAAPKAQLDAAETALARANAGVLAARAGATELSAVRDYSQIRAPFDGVVTRRFVDPGAFATPGAPLLTVQDTRRLRVAVTAAPDGVRSLRRGDAIAARIEGVPTQAIVEGVVPAGGSVYTVNAIVDNQQGRFLPGSAANLALPVGARSALLVPTLALRRTGDVVGVMVNTAGGPELRWVRVGRTVGDRTEIVAGLRDGEQIVVPARIAGAR